MTSASGAADAPRKKTAPIKDAATLIIYRRDPDAIRLLMGRRAASVKFMPGVLVFPGGRLERSDWRAPSADDLHPVTEAKLLSATNARMSPERARAMALAAIRETFEETGVLIGRRIDASPAQVPEGWRPFLDQGIMPALGGLSFIGRAITPVSLPKRFDTRFFAVDATEIAGKVDTHEDELEAIDWVTVDEALAAKTARITEMVLEDLRERFARFEATSDHHAIPAPFRRMLPGAIVGKLLML